MSRKTVFAFTPHRRFNSSGRGFNCRDPYVNNLPQRLSQHETILLGAEPPRAPARPPCVLVRDSKDGAPLPGSAVLAVAHQHAQGGLAAGHEAVLPEQYGLVLAEPLRQVVNVEGRGN